MSSPVRYHTGSVATGARKSRRARRGRAAVKASAGLSLWHLKLRLSETAALGVHAKNARIFALRQGRWEELLEDETSLAGAAQL